MNGRGTQDDVQTLLLEVIRRRAAFEALESEPMSKRELAETVGVSGATAHRILASFREWGLIERSDEGHGVTPLGTEIGRAAGDYRARVETALRLEPLFSAVDLDGTFDIETFADATVTVAEHGNPYGPLNRFTTLLEETESLRGFDTTSVAPTYVEDIHAKIADGMSVEVVYDYGIVDQLATEYAQLAADAFDRDNLVLRVHEDVPFGLALFDDRVGIGGYDDETGLLTVFVDTDDPGAIEWGERLFESYWEGSSAV
ncbi:transcriptional regulator FilR1 domain-containing protein [Halomontanus rarus]|uniref:transcriptional regulator FilR1 domain-containing protein n=1 Tax=Halomontanus rarus TaxID=3034020 RepID=UPI001A99C009